MCMIMSLDVEKMQILESIRKLLLFRLFILLFFRAPTLPHTGSASNLPANITDSANEPYNEAVITY